MNYSDLPKAELASYHGHSVLDARYLSRQGCFSKVILWIEGHHNVPYARYIKGWKGPETEVICSRIMPQRIITVTQKE